MHQSITVSNQRKIYSNVGCGLYFDCYIIFPVKHISKHACAIYTIKYAHYLFYIFFIVLYCCFLCQWTYSYESFIHICQGSLAAMGLLYDCGNKSKQNRNCQIQCISILIELPRDCQRKTQCFSMLLELLYFVKIPFLPLLVWDNQWPLLLTWFNPSMDK